MQRRTTLYIRIAATGTWNPQCFCRSHFYILRFYRQSDLQSGIETGLFVTMVSPLDRSIEFGTNRRTNATATGLHFIPSDFGNKG
jgi:hypothetical protein